MNHPPPPEFLQTQWFLPLFALMWVAISFSLSRTSGWSKLSAQFKPEQAPEGEQFRFVTGSMGMGRFPVSYGGCLFVTVNDLGFNLSLLFPFRLFCPPLFIPWQAVESVEQKRFLFVRYTVIRLRDYWPVISIRGKAGELILKTFPNNP